MKFIGYLTGASILAAIVFTIVSGSVGLGAEKEIWFGMLCPTLAFIVSGLVIERQRRISPQKIFKRRIQIFVVKFLFFGVYIAVLVKMGQVKPELFFVCFAFFYLALHIAEAYELRGGAVPVDE